MVFQSTNLENIPPFHKREIIHWWWQNYPYQQPTTNFGQLEHDGWSTTYAMVFMWPSLSGSFLVHLQDTMEEFVELYPTNLGRCQDLFSYKNNIMQNPEKGVWSPVYSRMLESHLTNALDRAPCKGWCLVSVFSLSGSQVQKKNPQ
jgi:hypothetical protein